MEGATAKAHRIVPLVDDVILTDDHQTGTTIVDSASNRTIGEDVEVCQRDEGKSLKQKVSAEMVTFSCQLV